MTEGQLKFRTLNEEMRHNRVVEEYGRTQAQASMKQAEAAHRQAATSERNVSVTEANAKSVRWKNFSDAFLGAFKSAQAFAAGFKDMMGAASTIAGLFA